MTVESETRRAERLLVPAAFITALGNNVQLIAGALVMIRTDRTMMAVGWLFIAVAFGLSETEEDGHKDVYLMRAFPSLDVMHAQEGSFYSGEAWIKGPRDAVVGKIASYHAVALELSERAVDELRTGA
jgi:hypothetical protein